MTPELNFTLTQGLKLIGLKDSVYWLTWQVGNLCLYAYGPNIWYCYSLPRAVTGLVIAFLSTLVLMVTGMYYTAVIEEANVILLNSVCMYIIIFLSLSSQGYACQLQFFLNTEPDIIFCESLTLPLTPHLNLFLSPSLTLALPPLSLSLSISSLLSVCSVILHL